MQNHRKIKISLFGQERFVGNNSSLVRDESKAKRYYVDSSAEARVEFTTDFKTFSAATDNVEYTEHKG